MEGTSIRPPFSALHPRFTPGEEVVFALDRAEFWVGARTPRRKPRWGIGRILDWRTDAQDIIYTLSIRFAARPLLCRVLECDIEGLA
ncbi:MAG TPA: hypothetical protein VJP07_04145 [Dehalococcoidia bacterium]|nr:hypothetical protein [Dehalococcoidia bacterium]